MYAPFALNLAVIHTCLASIGSITNASANGTAEINCAQCAGKALKA